MAKWPTVRTSDIFPFHRTRPLCYYIYYNNQITGLSRGRHFRSIDYICILINKWFDPWSNSHLDVIPMLGALFTGIRNALGQVFRFALITFITCQTRFARRPHFPHWRSVWAGYFVGFAVFCLHVWEQQMCVKLNTLSAFAVRSRKTNSIRTTRALNGN